MNILKSLLNTNSKQDTVNQSPQNLLQNKSREILLIISTLMTACEGGLLTPPNPTQGKSVEVEEPTSPQPELEVVQHIGHACSESDDNEIAAEVFGSKFKENCETEQRCEGNDYNCDSSTCQIQDNTFNICITANHDNPIIFSLGERFNIHCWKTGSENAPYCQISMGQTFQLQNKYNYQCSGRNPISLESGDIRFYPQDLLSSQIVCDPNTGNCLTTAEYVRINSSIPDDLYETCISTNYGHCHAQYVTVTSEEKANGERTYCLQATLNN